ncbi:MAPEG family protein [Acuticoccus kandeliae]|uniref:MAPEG family protein n=1 Tax=Acuticoccus kandeliae TaxID=2073160 RepID=UPI000D3E919A|nr:MAPEG family protein [Acuticoccus kandeliae]
MTAVPTELVCVGLAGLLVIVQILLPSGARMMANGLTWAAGPRDTVPAPLPPAAARAERALRNMLETFPVFVGFAIAVVVAGVSSDWTRTGAILYLVARIAYVPAYVFHIQFVRSGLWGMALLGIFILAAPLVAGVL